MNAFVYLPEHEPLTEAPLFWIEPRDRDLASEDDRQGEFARIIRGTPGVHIAAVLNDGKRGQKALNRANKLGAWWGFGDTIVFAEPRLVAVIEFKNGTAMPKQHQVDCLNALHRMGFPVAVCRTAAGAIAFLRDNGFPVEVRDAA
jgi:hypothetical protein